MICLCWMNGACSDNEDTTPSMADTDRLETLIDTSNADIVEFKEKYGTYILYEFDDLLDFAYQFEEASAWRSAVITKLDAEDVPNAVSFLKEYFLNCYTEDLYINYFPRKLLICSKIQAGTLGLSTGDGTGYHYAAANLNSMTIAKLDKETLDGMTDTEQDTFIRQMHYIFLGGYLANARSYYYVDDSFFDYSQTYYNSLMDTNRTQAQNLSDSFFYEKGFFRPEDGEDTYFGTAEDDLIAFTKNLILMDESILETVQSNDMLNQKMQLVAQGLKEIGVEVETINPLSANFLE